MTAAPRPVVDPPSPQLSPTPAQQSAPEIEPPTLTRKETRSYLERIRASGKSTPAEMQEKEAKWRANQSNAQREAWVRRRKEGRDTIPRKRISSASPASGPRRYPPKLPTPQGTRFIATLRAEAAAKKKAREAEKKTSAASLKAGETRRPTAEMPKPPPPSPPSEEALAQKRKETAAKRSAALRYHWKHKAVSLTRTEDLARANQQARREAQLSLARKKGAESTGAGTSRGKLTRRDELTVLPRGLTGMGAPGSAFTQYQRKPVSPGADGESHPAGAPSGSEPRVHPVVGSGSSAFTSVSPSALTSNAHGAAHPARQPSSLDHSPATNGKAKKGVSYLQRLEASGSQSNTDLQQKATDWKLKLSNAQREAWVRRYDEGRGHSPNLSAAMKKYWEERRAQGKVPTSTRSHKRKKPAPTPQEELAQANEQARREAQLALGTRKQKQAGSSSTSGAPKRGPA